MKRNCRRHEDRVCNILPRFRMFAVAVIFLTITSSILAECDQYLQYPQAGHPVSVVEIHKSDKQVALFEPLRRTKLILMEPGICKNQQLEGWYSGRVFILKSFTPTLKYGQVIDIDAGRFK